MGRLSSPAWRLGAWDCHMNELPPTSSSSTIAGAPAGTKVPLKFAASTIPPRPSSAVLPWRGVSPEGVETGRAAPKPRIIRESVKDCPRPQNGYGASYGLGRRRPWSVRKSAGLKRAMRVQVPPPAPRLARAVTLPAVRCAQAASNLADGVCKMLS